VTAVAQVLADARARFTGSSSPALDAEVLLCHALRRNRAWLHAWPEADIGPPDLARFEELAARRAVGEPIAYIVGHKEFWSLDIEVTPDVLIPRPETELVVECALAHIRGRGLVEPDVLDVGTGSGCIAIALGHERPDAHVVALDQSHTAAELAHRNAEHNGVPNVEVVEGCWFAPLGARRFDLVVSNPPYVATGDPHLFQGDARFEPVAALDGGPDGLCALREIAQAAPHHLRDGGMLIAEHGGDQGAAVRALFAQTGLTGAETRLDGAGIERVTLAYAPGAPQ